MPGLSVATAGHHGHTSSHGCASALKGSVAPYMPLGRSSSYDTRSLRRIQLGSAPIERLHMLTMELGAPGSWPLRHRGRCRAGPRHRARRRVKIRSRRRRLRRRHRRRCGSPWTAMRKKATTASLEWKRPPMQPFEASFGLSAAKAERRVVLIYTHTHTPGSREDRCIVHGADVAGPPEATAPGDSPTGAQTRHGWALRALPRRPSTWLRRSGGPRGPRVPRRLRGGRSELLPE